MSLQKLYIIHCPSTRTLKIGISKNVDSRLSTLQTGNPHKLNLLHVINCSDAHSLEQRLHRQFGANRLTGEWFNDSILDSLKLKLNIGVKKNNKENNNILFGFELISTVLVIISFLSMFHNMPEKPKTELELFYETMNFDGM